MDNETNQRRSGCANFKPFWDRPKRRDRFGGERRNFAASQGGIGVAIFLIIIGIVLFLDNIGVVRNIWEYWPLAICAFGLTHIFNSRSLLGRIWGGMLLSIGVLLICHNIGLLPWNSGAIWALFLVGFGVMLLLHNILERQVDPAAAPGTEEAAAQFGGRAENTVKEWVVFTGAKRRVLSTAFRGGELLAIFGGIELDLRRATPPPGITEIVVDTIAVFGGIEIRIPDNWHVVIRGVGVLGAYEDKSIPQPVVADSEPVTLVLTGSAVFGGVTVQ